MRHIPCPILCYTNPMDNLMTIPKDRKPPRVGRICLLIGMTVLIYMALANHFGFTADMVRVVTHQGS